jgi:flagellar motor switch protein FliM
MAEADAAADAGAEADAAAAVGDAATDAAAAAAGGAEAEASDSAISEEEVSALLAGGASDRVRSFDLAAVRISRTKLPMLETVSRIFAERISASLSGLIGRDMTVQFTGLDSSKAIEAQAALPVPASLVTVRIKPLPGTAFVTVQPTLMLALMDSFFGGPGLPTTDPQAAVTPSAQRFIAVVMKAMAADWTTAWTPVSPLEVDVVKQETNPRLMHLGEPQDPLLVLKFNVEFGATSGRIDWLIPESLLEPLREVLAAEGGKPAARSAAHWAPVIGASLLDAQLETRAILAQAEVTLGDLVRLSPGDIIPIEPPQEADLLAGDILLFRGRFGISQGQNSLKIISGGSA